jgi:hypothetical protein
MSKMQLFTSLFSKLNYRKAIHEIQENAVQFPIDYEYDSFLWGVPSVDLLKYYTYQIFDLVYHNKKKEFTLSVFNNYIIMRKKEFTFYVKLGNYEREVEYNRSLKTEER